MSKTKQILELDSPTLKTRSERLTGLAQQCNYCCGSGWFWGLDEFHETVKQPCPMCGGAGRIVPEITIEWKSISSIK